MKIFDIFKVANCVYSQFEALKKNFVPIDCQTNVIKGQFFFLRTFWVLFLFLSYYLSNKRFEKTFFVVVTLVCFWTISKEDEKNNHNNNNNYNNNQNNNNNFETKRVHIG